VAEREAEVEQRAHVAAALAGDEAALGQLLALEQAWAYNVAYRVLGREADAKDAVQEAFLLTVRALRGDGAPPRSVDAFKTWLRRVVVNAALGQIRRRPPVQNVSVDRVAEEIPAPEQAEAGRTVDHEETRAQVLRVLLGLPESQRVALALRELLDASYDDIAEVLDLPRTAVGTLLFRARSGFRSSFDRVAAASPPMECPDLVPLYSAIVDDEPRPETWQVLEEHLQACDRCGTELTEQRRARRLYALIPLLAVPAGWEPAQAAIQAVTGAGSGVAAATPPDPGALTAASSVSPAVPVPLSGVEQVAPSVVSAGTTGSAGVAGGATAVKAGGGVLSGIVGSKLAVGALAVVATVGTVVASGSLGDLALPGSVVASPSPAVGGSPGLTTLASPSPAPSVAVLPSPAPGAAGAAAASSPTASSAPALTLTATPTMPVPASGTQDASTLQVATRSAQTPGAGQVPVSSTPSASPAP
jgi:RNA polymerase sigma-70 factor (ECF subfamily)